MPIHLTTHPFLLFLVSMFLHISYYLINTYYAPRTTIGMLHIWHILLTTNYEVQVIILLLQMGWLRLREGVSLPHLLSGELGSKCMSAWVQSSQLFHWVTLALCVLSSWSSSAFLPSSTKPHLYRAPMSKEASYSVSWNQIGGYATLWHWQHSILWFQNFSDSEIFFFF